MTLIKSLHTYLPPAAVALALAAPLAVALGALGCKAGLWNWQIGLLVVSGLGGLILAVLAATASLCALIVTAAIPPRGHGLFLAGTGLLIAAMTLGRMAMVAALAAGLPPINDVRTSDHPSLRFSDAVLAARGSASRWTYFDTAIDSPGKWHGKQRSEAQAIAYPRVARVHLDADITIAAGSAQRIAERQGWVIDSNTADGAVRIAARALSPWYGFTDDVVIVLTPGEDGVDLDLRSASRVGISDLGANARRIAAFIDDMILASSRSAS